MFKWLHSLFRSKKTRLIRCTNEQGFSYPDGRLILWENGQRLKVIGVIAPINLNDFHLRIAETYDYA